MGGLPAGADGGVCRLVVTKQVGDELHDDESVDAGAEVVDDDAGTFGECFEAADGRRLEYVEEAEEEKSEESVRPVGGKREERDELAGDFIDDDEAGVFALRFARDACGGGDTECDGKRERDDRRDEEVVCVVVQQRGSREPEQSRRDRRISARAWLEEAGAEKGCDGPGPERFFLPLLHVPIVARESRAVVEGCYC